MTSALRGSGRLCVSATTTRLRPPSGRSGSDSRTCSSRRFRTALDVRDELSSPPPRLPAVAVAQVPRTAALASAPACASAASGATSSITWPSAPTTGRRWRMRRSMSRRRSRSSSGSHSDTALLAARLRGPCGRCGGRSSRRRSGGRSRRRAQTPSTVDDRAPRRRTSPRAGRAWRGAGKPSQRSAPAGSGSCCRGWRPTSMPDRSSWSDRRLAPCLVRVSDEGALDSRRRAGCARAPRALLAAGDEDHRLGDLLGRRDLRRHRHPRRVDQHAVRERLDGGRHRRGEEERLALPGDGRADAADVVDEAHVEHAVGLVEHEVRHAVEAHVPLAHQVEQAARRGDEHLRRATQRELLAALPHAAVDDRVRDALAGGRTPRPARRSAPRAPAWA